MIPRVLVLSSNQAELVEVRKVLQESIEDVDVLLVLRGSTAIRHLQDAPVELLVTGYPLSDLSPAVFCERARLISDCKMLALCEGGDPTFVVDLLNWGSDACLTRPVDWQELATQAQDLLGRVSHQRQQLRFGDVEVDLSQGIVYRDEQELRLNNRLSRLLRFFSRHVNQEISREQIAQGVWYREVPKSSRTIDQYIGKLRKLIEPDPDNPRYLLTVYGVGYKLIRPRRVERSNV